MEKKIARIDRRKITPTAGTNYRFAFKYVYDVVAVETGAELIYGAEMLSIARRVARRAGLVPSVTWVVASREGREN